MVNAVIRTFLLFTLAFFASAAPAVTPPDWKPADLPRRPAEFYTIEIASFPSTLLASGVRHSLENVGWGPVFTLTEPDKTVITLGEFEDLGAAWYVQMELEVQDVASGTLRLLPKEHRSALARNASGPFLDPFLPSEPITVNGKPWDLASAIDKVRSATSDLEGEDKKTVDRMMALWSEQDFSNLDFARSLIFALEYMKTKSSKADTDVLMVLAGRLARGEWPAGPATKARARVLMAELLHAEKSDWRAAWAANSVLLDSPDLSLEEQLEVRMRRVALVAALVKEQHTPAPTYDMIRLRIRRAADLIPVGHPDLEAKVAVAYMQTFAWEGRWGRVDELARGIRKNYPKQRPAWDLATIYFAKSLERYHDYDRAIELVNSILEDPITDQTQWPQFGMTRIDLRDMAREERQRFQGLSLGAAE